MRVEIVKGVLLIVAETNTEEYALGKWYNDATIESVLSLQNKETVTFSGSKIKICEDIQ